MRFLLMILLCFVPMNVWAAIGAGDVDFTAEERWDDFGYDMAAQTWWGTTGGVRYDGEGVCSKQSGITGEIQDNIIPDSTGNSCWCRVNSPFDGMYVSWTDFGSYGPNGVGCNDMCAEACVEERPYTASGFPSRATQTMNFHNILISAKRVQVAFYLNVSNGVQIPIYAQKSTTPALHVLRDGVVYYGNAEPGIGTGTMNIYYNGAYYHLVK